MNTFFQKKTSFPILEATIFVTLAFLALFVLDKTGLSEAGVSVTATVSGPCGDGIVDPGEQCDGGSLAGQSCSSFNFTGGTLSCSGTCSFDISACTNLTSPSSGGGGGGGSSASTVDTATAVFSGNAFPGSTIRLLKDGFIAGRTVSGPDARFQISLSSLTPGSYTFSLQAEDVNALISTTQNFPITFGANLSTSITGIFFAPTISADKEQVRQGDVITIFGQTTPKATVKIDVHSDNRIVGTTTSDTNGSYLYRVDTDTLEKGSHEAISRATVLNDISPDSAKFGFVVGDQNINLKAGKRCSGSSGDLNCDGRVNLVDFSIMAYWYKRASPPTTVDLTSDGKVDLIDFSILAYHWTG